MPDRGSSRRDLSTMQPFRELDSMRQRFQDEIARPFLRSIWDRIPEEIKEWGPTMDIYEKGDNYIVKVELPGVKQEDVDVSVTEDSLTIKGEKRSETGIKNEDYFKTEMTYGNFYRSITLPSTIDTQNIDAVYEDGVLRITLPMAKGAKRKKVSVKVKKSSSGSSSSS